MLKYEIQKRSLTERLHEMQMRVGQIESDICAPEDTDLSDQALLDADDEKLEALDESGLSEISDIKASLARIEQGTYGICTNCGCVIPADRLEAMPMASLCIECAEDFDRLHHRL
jgi:DnaK suppressor protein